MKTQRKIINAITDPLSVHLSLGVNTGSPEQIYNPSRNEYAPNRKIYATVIQADLSIYDPNTGETYGTFDGVAWYVDNINVDNLDGFYHYNANEVHYLDCSVNGTADKPTLEVRCVAYYINPSSGARERTENTIMLTTTVNDSEQFLLAPTTTQVAMYNPVKNDGSKIQEFGCKLLSADKQTPAAYYWYERKDGVDVLLTGGERYFISGYDYEFDYIEDTEWGTITEIDHNSWRLVEATDNGHWAQIKVDVEKMNNVHLVCKAAPAWLGESFPLKGRDTLTADFRASLQLPVLKRVEQHSIQGYTTKANAAPSASHYKAYVSIFCGSQEYNGNVAEEKDIIDTFFSVVWYSELKNQKKVLGYGATLDITYEALGITQNSNGYIDTATIPAIYAEVTENYAGGAEGVLYSNYMTPNPKAIVGNNSIADDLRAYLVKTTYDENGKADVSIQRLMENNWFRFEDGRPAPTMLCSAVQKAEILGKVASGHEDIVVNSLGENTYLGIPVDCYNETGMDENLDILYGWAEDVWTIELHQPDDNSGEMVCYFGREPFEVDFNGQILIATHIPPTLVCPSLPTLHNGKFRCIFSMPGSGFGSNGSKGIDGVSTPFYDENYAWVACGISNLTNNTYSFAKNNNASEDNTPYAPLMHWHHNNILCALEQKFGSAVLHDESMFGAGISSNSEFTMGSNEKYSGIINSGSTYKFNSTPSNIYYKKADGSLAQTNWSALLNNEGSRMLCLEPQLVISYVVEQKYGFGTLYNELISDGNYFRFSLGYNGRYKVYSKNFGECDYGMSDIVQRHSVCDNTAMPLFDSGGNAITSGRHIYAQMSCVHGIDLVSADVYQNQNGIENILTVSNTTSGADGEKRQIYLCKDQNKLYRGTETSVGSGETYAFETDGTYELVADKDESQQTAGYGHNFVKGTCIPKTKGGDLSSISGYYTTINSSPSIINVEGNRNRMGFKNRGSAKSPNTFVRAVFANNIVTDSRNSNAGGFQILLPKKGQTDRDVLAYGVEWDTASDSPTCRRIGNYNLHRGVPVQNKMVGVILNDIGNEVMELTNEAWQVASNLDGSKGQVMIRIPKHYRKFETSGTINRVWLSEHPLDGFNEVPMSYVSAYQATLDSNNKLASIKAADGSILPATKLSRTRFRNSARARNNGNPQWNLMTYDTQKTLYWLYVTEFATLNSQAEFIEHPTDYTAFHRGGLGAGVSNLDATKWDAFNGYNPFIPCGYTDGLGNGSGEVIYTMPEAYDTTLLDVKVNRYRGIENPFGHIFQWTDGINIEVQPDGEGEGYGLSKVYVCSDPSKFTDDSYTGYDYVGNESRNSGYVTKIIFGEGGEIMPSECSGGSSTKYYCDNHNTNTAISSVELRGVLFGGYALSGSYAGFVCAITSFAPSLSLAYIGSRLCFIPLK